jgi:hypothetical protein
VGRISVLEKRHVVGAREDLLHLAPPLQYFPHLSHEEEVYPSLLVEINHVHLDLW